MAVEKKPFEIEVAGYDLALTLGKCACVLFRTMPEVDYLKIDISEESGIEDNSLTVFDNVELVRWMAGITFREDGLPLKTLMNGESFEDMHGWSPATVIKWQPDEHEKNDYAEIVSENLETEWKDFTDD